MPELSEGQEILIVLCLLYLSDCLCWVSRSAVLFTAPFCRGWGIGRPNSRLGNTKGALAWLNPLPPLGEAFVVNWSRLSVSPRGFCDYTISTPTVMGRPRFTGTAYQFADVTRIELQGSEVLINEKPFVACSSGYEAAEVASGLKALRDCPETERAAMIERGLKGRLDRKKAKRALERARKLAWEVRISGLLLLFTLLFLALPAIGWLYDVRVYFLPGAAAVLLISWLCAWSYWTAHKRLFPKASGDRLATTIKMCGCPPLAVRAADQVSLHALSAFHPLAAGRALGVTGYEKMAGAFLRDLRHPLPQGVDDELTREVSKWYAEAEFEACAKFLSAERVITLELAFAPPARMETCTQYCPRCELQLEPNAKQCPDCPGVGLVQFPAAAISAAT